MITRAEELELRQKACFTGKRFRNNIKAIHVCKDGLKIELKKPYGYEDIISQVVAAPCSISRFMIYFHRDKTDRQIINETLQTFYDHQAALEEEIEAKQNQDWEDLYAESEGPEFEWDTDGDEWD